MNLRALKTFVAIVDLKSFQEAARHLILSQSNASMQIKTLEEELGVTLFDRNERPPSITAAGMAIVSPARELLLLARAIPQLAIEADKSGVLSGSLNVGTIQTAAINMLPNTLNTIYNKHSEVKVFVQSGLSDALPLRVLSGELDGAIVTRPSKLEQRLKAFDIYQEPLVLISPKKWNKEITLDQLSDVAYIRFNRNAGVGRIIDSFMIKHGIETQDIMELDSVDAILGMVANGFGTSIVPINSIAPHHRKDIKVACQDQLMLARDVVFIVSTQSRTNPLSEAFIEALRKTVSGLKN